VALPGIAVGTRGLVKEIGRLFLVVAFPDGRQGYYARRQLAPVLACQDGEQSSEPLVALGVANARLPRGSHGCLLPSDDGTAINTVARYLGAGLAAGETAICWFPAKWQEGFLRGLRQLGVEASVALRDRKLTILNPCKVYLQEPEFTANKQLERTTTAVSALTKEHSDGVRLFGYVGRRLAMEGWWEYESRFTPIAKALGVTTLCGYPDLSGDAESSRLAAETHTYLIKDGQVLAGGQAIGG
jgi:hypothetical protein